MSQEAPTSKPEALAQPSRFRSFSHALEQHGKDAAIAFAATTLVLVLRSANPLPASTESTTGNTTSADNNPITLNLGPGLETVDPVRLAGPFAVLGLLAAVGVGVIIKEDDKNK